MDTNEWMALFYTSGAFVCVMADFRHALAVGDWARRLNLWRRCAVVLLFLAINALLQLEDAFVLWARDVAQGLGWYVLRRPIQIGMLLALVAGVALWSQKISRYSLHSSQVRYSVESVMAAGGIFLLLSMLALNLVSFHYTDQALNFRFAGLRVARFIELGGLGLVTLGGVQHLLRER